MRRALAIVAVLFAADSAIGATYTIKPDGTGDFPTIQDAVDAAAHGDEIILQDGTYTGARNRDVDYLGKAITIRSMSGLPDLCVVDCEYASDPSGRCEQRGFIFRSGEGPGAVLEGVTVRRAMDQGLLSCEYGGMGLWVEQSSPTIRNVTVTEVYSWFGAVSLDSSGASVENCTFSNNAGPVVISGSAPTITGCLIEANSSNRSSGGGVSISQSSATIENCVVRGNLAQDLSGNGPHRGGGIFIIGGSPIIRNCVITGNRAVDEGGGILITSTSVPRIEGCTISSNEAARGGGIYHGGGVYWGRGTPALDRTIVWGNCASLEGADVYVRSGLSLDFTCCNVDLAGVGGPGVVVWSADNSFMNPRLCEPLDCALVPDVGGVFTVDDDSHVLSAPNCGLIGALGAGCTISVESLSWGAVKGKYRE